MRLFPLIRGGAAVCSPRYWLALVIAVSVSVVHAAAEPPDHRAPLAVPVRQLQQAAIASGKADWGHWGPQPETYSGWKTHTNRLVPIYTFGVDLAAVRGKNSLYRNEQRLTKCYGYLPENTHNPDAEYFDQTDVYRLQQLAVELGKKRIVLIIFDGMDWETTWAAAIYRSGKVGYRSGRGTGLHFQDYRGTQTDFGFFVCSPHSGAARVDVDAQLVVELSPSRGGYDWRRAGATPWETGSDPLYIINRSRECRHVYTDSAASATSMTSGIKTYNDAINVDPAGRQVEPIARQLQRDGFAVGVVTSVPISHATPACAYANNVHRDDYQDLTRDMLGLPSVAHRTKPLPGVEVLLGAGWGESTPVDPAQGANFVPGNQFLTDADREAVDVDHGGNYVVVQRASGVNGRKSLDAAAQRAVANGHRLLGFFGVKGGHLPYRTASGDYRPISGLADETPLYSQADLHENPTLADMTRAALEVLASHSDRFWLMIEPGDVDWANHRNDLDCSIGAVISGDEAFRAVTDWVERNNAWADTAVIVTADHGHYLVLRRPEVLAAAAQR